MNCIQFTMAKYSGAPVIVLALFSFLALSSCISPKSTTYVKNLPVAKEVQLDTLKIPEPLILVNDVLEVKVGGESQETVQYLNNYFGGVAATASLTGLSFTVDVNGNINLPKVGNVKVAGLTRDQARDTLTNAYKRYLVNPVVSVRFSNFRFSVLGVVKSPGSFTSTNDTLSIFEAIAQAGDITQFGYFDNVKIIRDVNGKRSVITLNLLDKGILNSQDYYLNRYDVIYVPSRSLKSVTENFSRTSTFIATITSVLAIILVLFKK